MNTLDIWEAQWAPYDETTYQAALSHIQSADIVLDIGAGDLRLARRMAHIAHHVFAIEMQPNLIEHDPPLPANLTVIHADARYVPWPKHVSIGVLLMRHCTHLKLYASRLRKSGCRYLVTNARWGMDVELMDLMKPRIPWTRVKTGWYACTCGQIGFGPEPSGPLTERQIWQVTEVETCPACLAWPEK